MKIQCNSGIQKHCLYLWNLFEVENIKMTELSISKNFRNISEIRSSLLNFGKDIFNYSSVRSDYVC